MLRARQIQALDLAVPAFTGGSLPAGEQFSFDLVQACQHLRIHLQDRAAKASFSELGHLPLLSGLPGGCLRGWRQLGTRHVGWSGKRLCWWRGRLSGCCIRPGLAAGRRRQRFARAGRRWSWGRRRREREVGLVRDSLAIPVLSYALWVAFTGSGSSLNELGAQSPQFGGGKPRAGSPSGEPRLASAISMTLMSGV